MTIVTTFFIVIGIIVLMLVGFLVFIVRRKNNSFALHIIADNSKTATFRTLQNYNLRVGRHGELKAAKIYRGLLSFKPLEIHAEFGQVDSFKWHGRNLYGIRSPTGDQEDDTIVLIKPPIISVLDMDRRSQLISNSVYIEIQKFFNENKSPTNDKLQSFIKSTFTPTWLQSTMGVSEVLDKKDILPRSIKLAYAQEIEQSYNMEARHQGTINALVKYAPFLMIAILAIGIGVGISAAYQQLASYATTINQMQLAAYNYYQSQSAAIGHALAEAHIYGYNFTVPNPTTTIPQSSGGLPAIP